MLSKTFGLMAILLAFTAQAAACPPRERLVELKAGKWVVADEAARQTLALGMLDCLASPDPFVRDEAGYEGLQFWMRSDKLDEATVRAIDSNLLARLAGPDPQGFARPFAALVLAEVARIDRRKAFLSTSERSALVLAATTYLSSVRDYRGFDEREGWRHGVAHAADLLLQLALNPLLDKAAQQSMLAAIASQVNAAGVHFYIYGEGERLMAPVFYLARRETLSVADWDAWFAMLAAKPEGLRPSTQTFMAWRHNLNGFLLPLYASLSESTDAAQRARILPAVSKALKALG